MPFVDKELSKAVMIGTKLRNNFLQNKSEENRKLYPKQRNFSVSNWYYENLNEESIIDNKHFLKTVKPFFSFTFTEVDKKVVEQLILNQDVNKVQSSDTPLKIVMEIIDIFSGFLCASLKSSRKSTKFCQNLKLADSNSSQER